MSKPSPYPNVEDVFCAFLLLPVFHYLIISLINTNVNTTIAYRNYNNYHD